MAGIDPQRKALIDVLNQKEQERLAKQPPPSPLSQALAAAAKPFQGYFDRQGKLAREGWDQANMGAEQLRAGDLPMGAANALLGPVNWLTSGINALLPEEQATRDFGRSLGGNFGEAAAAGGLGLAAIALPGPDVGKGGKVRAAIGGEKGINGYPYKGGQFLPSTNQAPGLFTIGGKKVKARELEVEPGRREAQPSAGAIPIYPQVTAYAKRGADGKFELLPNVKDATGKPVTADSPSGVGELTWGEMIDAYHGGQRWFEPGVKAADEAAEGITAYHGSPQLPPQALTPDGVQTGWVFRDVDRGGLHYPAVSKSQMRAMNRSTDLEDWDEVEVPIRGMFATQNRVNNDFSEAASKRSGDLPLAVRVNGKIYLRDGHHRVVAAAASGKQTAKIRLVDVDRMAADGAGQADIADILKRYAIPFTLGAGGAAIVSGANMPPELAAQMEPQA